MRRGHLHLYPDERTLAQDAAGWDLRRRHGCQFERLDRAGLLALEPEINKRYGVGIFLADQATVINPFRYVQAVFKKFLEIGGKILRAEAQSLQATECGWRIKLDRGTYAAHHVVIATGAHSRRLLDPLGIRLPLETQRGYHVQFQGSAPVSRTVVLTDHKVFVTPMEQGLRVGGTVEFGGLDMPANPKRVDALLRIALANFDGLAGQPFSTWMGHRPCMPDSVPVIGPAPHQRNLWLAVGHGHLGLTDSVHTAELVANGMLAHDAPS
jgi:D-amino-acid dehydrogenase